jgi:hypothetical protein
MELLALLVNLVGANKLRVAYRVKISKGEYSEEEFDSPSEFDEVVYDSSFKPVAVTPYNIVPVYIPR